MGYNDRKYTFKINKKSFVILKNLKTFSLYYDSSSPSRLYNTITTYSNIIG